MTGEQIMWHYESTVYSFCCIDDIWKVCNSWWGIFPLKLQRPRSLFHFVHILNETKKPKGTKLRRYIGEGFVTIWAHRLILLCICSICYAEQMLCTLLRIIAYFLWYILIYILRWAMHYMDLCKWAELYTIVLLVSISQNC